MINGLCADYYAEKVIAAQRKDRQKLFNEVPAHLRPSVMKIVVNEFEMKQLKRKSK
jgi:hypothetical protein